MHALLFQSHLSIAITSKFTLWSLLLYTWSTYTIHLANQLCRQYPVDWLTQNYTLFRTGYIISFPRGRNLFHMQHIRSSSLTYFPVLTEVARVYCFIFGFVLLLYMVPYFSLKPWKIIKKVIEIKSYNWKIIEGSVWPGLWKT